MNTTKVASRFIPTLTEVVQSAPDLPAVDAPDLVAEVMRAMLPQIEEQLRASLLSSVESQVREAMSQLQGPMQQAIEEVLARR